MKASTGEGRQVLLPAPSPAKRDPGFEGMVGESPALLEMFERVRRLAVLQEPVLIVGETGTGKELVARALHNRSSHRAGPLVDVNCAAVPASLFESAFFGHVRGAFTDASQGADGWLIAASGGSLFLDEIGELAPEGQAKLLRAIEQRHVTPVGATRSLAVDVRVIAATNRDLVDAVRRGLFRADLYWRLNALEIHVPPVREREGDLRLLVQHFLVKLAAALRVNATDVSIEAAAAMTAHMWPGNVREVETVLRHALLSSTSGAIEFKDLPVTVRRRATGARHERSTIPEGLTLGDALSQACAHLECAWIEEALRSANGNQRRAAGRLGISPRTLYRKLRTYKIDLDNMNS